MDAVREIAERLDGKAPMGIIHANDPDNPLTRPDELTDAELARIAATGSAGIAEAPAGKGKPH